LEDLVIKYKIPTQDTVKRWVLKYNGHEELNASGTGGTLIMTNGRKTTYDERVEIVKYCIVVPYMDVLARKIFIHREDKLKWQDMQE
jgi:ribosomal protein L33